MKHDGVPRRHGTGWASVTPQPARNGFERGRSALVLRDRAPAHNDEISVVDGTTFVVSDALGDILPGSEHGFFRSDTRFLSALALTVDGERVVLLSSRATSPRTAAIYATNPRLANVPADTLTLVREPSLDGRLRETLAVTNHGPEPAELDIVFECASDFADIFEVRGHAGNGAASHPHPGRRAYAVRFDFRGARMRCATVIRSSEPPRVEEDGRLRYPVRLAPRETWRLDLDVEAWIAQPGPRRPSRAARQRQPTPEDASPPSLESDFEPLVRAYDEVVQDLQALRLVQIGGHSVPAAGLPWFMAIFGRDSLITSLETLALNPDLARGALHALARYQAREVDDFRDAEPGKIPHEIRHGRLAPRGRVPHGRYYGTVDATPLFLVTLAETVRWTGDLRLARRLLPAVEAVLRWIDQHGDQDGDGFVEY